MRFDEKKRKWQVPFAVTKAEDKVIVLEFERVRTEMCHETKGAILKAMKLYIEAFGDMGNQLSRGEITYVSTPNSRRRKQEEAQVEAVEDDSDE